jgi:hypothetical protein
MKFESRPFICNTSDRFKMGSCCAHGFDRDSYWLTGSRPRVASTLSTLLVAGSSSHVIKRAVVEYLFQTNSLGNRNRKFPRRVATYGKPQ